MMYRTLLCAFVFLSVVLPAAAQTTVDEPLVIGRGAVLDAVWSPDGTRILVNTVRGAWLYDDQLNDVAHLPLWHAAFSPDGAQLAGIDADRRAVVLDAATFAERAALAQVDPDITGLAWNPDSQRLALIVNKGFTAVVIWETQADTPLDWNYNGDTALRALHWNPAGTRLAALARDVPFAYIWGTEPNDHTFANISLGSPGSTPAGIEWIDDEHILTGFRDENWNMRVYNAVTGEATHDNNAFSAAAAAALSPDGDEIFIPLFQGGRIAPLAELPLPRPRPEDSAARDLDIWPTDTSWRIVASDWSPDGRQIAVAAYSFDGRVPRSIVWRVDPRSGEILQAIGLGADVVSMLAWHPDGKQIVVATQSNRLTILGAGPRPTRQLARWRTQDVNVLHTNVGDFRVSVTWSPDGNTLAVGDSLRSLVVWDVAARAVAHIFSWPLHADDDLTPFAEVVWHPSGRYIAATHHRYFYRAEPVAYIFDPMAVSTPPLYRIDPNRPDEDSPVHALAWHPSGDSLTVVSGSRASATIFDVPGNAEPRLVTVETQCDCAQVQDAIWNADGTRLMLSYFASRSGTQNYTAIWDDQRREQVATLPIASDLPRAWATDGAAVALEIETGLSTETQHTTILRLAPDGTLTSTALPEPDGRNHEAYLSPDGSRGAILNRDGDGLVYDVRRGRLVSMLHDTLDVAWSADGRRAAVLLEDGSVWVGDRDLRITAVLRDTAPLDAGDFVFSFQRAALFWSPDGSHLAVAYAGVVTVWAVDE